MIKTIYYSLSEVAHYVKTKIPEDLHKKSLLYIIIITIIFMMFLNVLTKMKKKNILLTALLAVLCSVSSIQAAVNPIQPIEKGSIGWLQQESVICKNNIGKKILNGGVKGLTAVASWLLPKMPLKLMPLRDIPNFFMNVPCFGISLAYRFLEGDIGRRISRLYEKLGFLGTLLSTILSLKFLVDVAIQIPKQKIQPAYEISLAVLLLFRFFFNKVIGKNEIVSREVLGFLCMMGEMGNFYFLLSEGERIGKWNELKTIFCLPLFFGGVKRLKELWDGRNAFLLPNTIPNSGETQSEFSNDSAGLEDDESEDPTANG
ncbi:MAG: hypothetical protein LBS83_02265 [Holosporales bacterium]|nr:hypothetical protein [Holosporales bacterium]